MASPFVEKLQVAVITATVVSAGWIMAGAIIMDREESAEIQGELREKQASGPIGQQEQADEAASGLPAGDTAEISTQPTQQTNIMIVPVQGVSVADLTDNFSDERGGGTRLHEAIDIMAEEGTSVIAAAPGTIERKFRSDSGGITLYIRSEDRDTIYYYAHLGGYAPGLNEGQLVRRGQRLGTVGSTGNADPGAPHLHFEVMRTTANAEWWEPATSVNPYPLLVGQAAE